VFKFVHTINIIVRFCSYFTGYVYLAAYFVRYSICMTDIILSHYLRQWAEHHGYNQTSLAMALREAAKVDIDFRPRVVRWWKGDDIPITSKGIRPRDLLTKVLRLDRFEMLLSPPTEPVPGISLTECDYSLIRNLLVIDLSDRLQLVRAVAAISERIETGNSALAEHLRRLAG
jgi:hypothetical protein